MATNTSPANSLINSLEDLFKKAPALPPNAKEIIVKITPIISLIFGILGVIAGVMGLLSLTVFAPFAMLGGAKAMYGYGNGYLASIILLVSSALLLAAYPGTKDHKFRGWEMLFWSEVVNVVGSLIQLEIFGAIIGGLIGFYILYQIKSDYK